MDYIDIALWAAKMMDEDDEYAMQSREYEEYMQKEYNKMMDKLVAFTLGGMTYRSFHKTDIAIAKQSGYTVKAVEPNTYPDVDMYCLYLPDGQLFDNPHGNYFYHEDGPWQGVPAFTSSLDDALTLPVPEDCGWFIHTGWKLVQLRDEEETVKAAASWREGPGPAWAVCDAWCQFMAKEHE